MTVKNILTIFKILLQDRPTRSAINFCNIFLGGLAKVNPF